MTPLDLKKMVPNPVHGHLNQTLEAEVVLVVHGLWNEVGSIYNKTTILTFRTDKVKMVLLLTEYIKQFLLQIEKRKFSFKLLPYLHLSCTQGSLCLQWLQKVTMLFLLMPIQLIQITQNQNKNCLKPVHHLVIMEKM